MTLEPQSNNHLKIAAVIGTRPEAVKMAPLILRLRETGWADVKVIATGQHRDLVDPMLALFGLRSDCDLALMRPGQSLNQLAASLIEALDREFTRSLPLSLVLAQGDTTTVVAASLASYFLKIPFGHVEAGLRTGNRFNPFPEEGNRIVASHLATVHFAPTQAAVDHLHAERIDPANVVLTGNTVIDALHYTSKFSPPLAIDLAADMRLILITAHRRDSFGEPIRMICEAVAMLQRSRPEIAFLWPVHPNPAVEPIVRERLGGLERVHLVKPLDHAAFVGAMKRSDLILTDSGGVQEEAPALGKPVLVLRDESERPEAIESGVAKLVGTDSSRIVREVERLLDDDTAYQAMVKHESPYGDGHASERIVAAIDARFRRLPSS